MKLFLNLSKFFSISAKFRTNFLLFSSKSFSNFPKSYTKSPPFHLSFAFSHKSELACRGFAENLKILWGYSVYELGSSVVDLMNYGSQILGSEKDSDHVSFQTGKKDSSHSWGGSCMNEIIKWEKYSEWYRLTLWLPWVPLQHTSILLNRLFLMARALVFANLESGRSALVVFLKYTKRWWCHSYQCH